LKFQFQLFLGEVQDGEPSLVNYINSKAIQTLTSSLKQETLNLL